MHQKSSFNPDSVISTADCCAFVGDIAMMRHLKIMSFMSIVTERSHSCACSAAAAGLLDVVKNSCELVLIAD